MSEAGDETEGENEEYIYYEGALSCRGDKDWPSPSRELLTTATESLHRWRALTVPPSFVCQALWPGQSASRRERGGENHVPSLQTLDKRACPHQLVLRTFHRPCLYSAGDTSVSRTW